MNGGGGVVKYDVCIGLEFVGYPCGGGVYACGCCAVMESIAKRSSNFASISAILASARVARSSYLVTASVRDSSSVFVSVACIATPNYWPIVVPPPSVILSSYSLIMCLRKWPIFSVVWDDLVPPFKGFCVHSSAFGELDERVTD